MLEERDLEFMRALWSRRAVVTYVLFGFNLALFAVMELAGGTTNEGTLMAFGVKSNYAIDQGEIWRFVTPIFIHIGLLHLFFNSYALWIVGPQVEKLYGTARFLLLYVITGIAGVVGSYWYHPEAISAGASGAIFGLFGVLLVFGLKYRSSIPPFFQKAVGMGVLPVIVLNIIIGFMIPAIDNAAHIGGLIAGAALAAIIPFDRPGTSTPKIFNVTQAVLLLMIAGSFYQVLAHYDGPSISFNNLGRGWGSMLGSRSNVQEFIDTLDTSQRAFDNAAQALDSEDPSRVADAKAQLSTAIDELNDIPSIADRADEMSQQLLSLMQAEYELLQEVERAGTITFTMGRRADQNVRRYAEVMKDFEEWVRTDGDDYGIQLRNGR